LFGNRFVSYKILGCKDKRKYVCGIQKINAMNEIPSAMPELIGSYSDLKDLREKVFNWLKATFKIKKVINKQTNFEIGFKSTTFDKLVSKAGEKKLLCLTAIEAIIETGVLEKVDVDRKQRNDVIAFYYFTSSVKYENEVYPYWFTVRLLIDGRYLYSGNMDIKKTL
jgi:hypothetical protein